MDWKEIGIIPLTDARGITKQFNASTHRGLDIGWYKNQYCPVLAWQDGKLIAKGYSGECGYWCVLEHTYDTGKRWVGFIHLYNQITRPLNSIYKMGEKIGNAKRGNTGYSNGTHLHIYMTKIIPKDEEFVWNNDTNKLSEYAIDPLPHLYYDKKYNTEFISTVWSRPLPERITYPEPVKRDESVHQCEIRSDTRRLRKSPSGEIYDEMCKKGIYNVYKEKEKDGYTWALIGTIENREFWVAVMEGEDLPVTDYKKLYEEEEKKNKQLTAQFELAQKDIQELNSQLAIATKRINDAIRVLKGE